MERIFRFKVLGTSQKFRPMTTKKSSSNTWSRVLIAILMYGCLLAIVQIIGNIQSDGIISTSWVLFMIAWGLFAGIGAAAGSLRLLKLLSNGRSQFYVFVAIGNLGNSLWGGILYHRPNRTEDTTVVWLLLGATFCLAALMLVDIFHSTSEVSGHA
jgi:hypothetical protein